MWRAHNLYSQWWLAWNQWPLQKIHCLHGKCSKTMQACLLQACIFLNTIGSWDQLKSLDSSARNVPTGELLWYSLCWLSFCLQIFLRRPHLGIDPQRAKLPCLVCLCEEPVQPKGRRLLPLSTDKNQNCQEKDIYFQVRWLQMASGGAKSSTTYFHTFNWKSTQKLFEMHWAKFVFMRRKHCQSMVSFLPKDLELHKLNSRLFLILWQLICFTHKNLNSFWRFLNDGFWEEFVSWNSEGGKILFVLEIASFYALLKSEGHKMTRVADTQIMKQNDDWTQI